MAQVGTPNDHAGLDPQKLLEFVDELRRSGFNIGTHVWGQFLKDYRSVDW